MMDFPEGWTIGPAISDWIDTAVDWAVVTWDAFFSAINTGVLAILLPMERFLMGEPAYSWVPSWFALPWWAVIAIVGFLAWKIVNRKTAALVVVSLGVLSLTGLHDLAMQTLAIVFTSTFLAIGFGLPLGILGAKSDRFDAAIRPALDAMQTMPSFVYLIPALMLFGIGKTPAVLAVVIYAIPPMIRLTNLGIRQVDLEVVEAARAFGSTASQVLAKVQLPMALPTIMAGVNQTVMMALAMVVVASMIGARGLGVEVLLGINRLEVGRGFLGGVGIVLMAIIIDRITQGLAKGPRARTA